jgi:hypothetical protein
LAHWPIDSSSIRVGRITFDFRNFGAIELGYKMNGGSLNADYFPLLVCAAHQADSSPVMSWQTFIAGHFGHPIRVAFAGCSSAIYRHSSKEIRVGHKGVFLPSRRP